MPGLDGARVVWGRVGCGGRVTATARAGGARTPPGPRPEVLREQEFERVPEYHGHGGGQPEIGRGRAPRPGRPAAGAAGGAAAGADRAAGEARGPAGGPPRPG